MHQLQPVLQVVKQDMRVVEVVHVMVPCITAQARLILAILGILVVQYHVGLKSFLDPNTAAIDVVLIFHSLFSLYIIYHFILYRHLLYRQLRLRCRHWIILTQHGPPLTYGLPSAGTNGVFGDPGYKSQKYCYCKPDGCKVGQKGPTGSCTSCDAGQYQGSNQYTATSCANCDPGRYSAAGAGSCSYCATGTYQGSYGQTSW